MKGNFNFIFENTSFYDKDKTMNVFKNINEIENYFDHFYLHYKDFKNFFTPLSDKRMSGKFVNNYTELQKYSVKLNDHYQLLLIIGYQLFDTFLNNRINKI